MKDEQKPESVPTLHPSSLILHPSSSGLAELIRVLAALLVRLDSEQKRLQESGEQLRDQQR